LKNKQKKSEITLEKNNKIMSEEEDGGQKSTISINSERTSDDVSEQKI
jgi:hypothetical protein